MDYGINKIESWKSSETSKKKNSTLKDDAPGKFLSIYSLNLFIYMFHKFM